jgi:Putative MetA-pathway of phenol degradation
MRLLLAAGVVLIFTAIPGYAQTDQELKQQLEAQKNINELLKQRIRTLEQKLMDAGSNSELLVNSNPATIPEPAPEKMAGDPEDNRALERALVREGLSVLPPGIGELATGMYWWHDGSDAFRSQSDDYIATLDARIGLPGGFMFGAGIPYIISAERDEGSNNGFGDASMRFWKQFQAQSDSKPSFIGSIGYRAPTAENSNDSIPLGSEFHRINVYLSSSKSIDPVILSGGLSYDHSFSEKINDTKFQPGDSYGLRGSGSLAITPEISGSLGLSVSFIDELELNGNKTDGTEQTVGFLELGTGFLLGNGSFIFLTSNIGITKDAPDFSLGISLPFRF